VFLGFVLKKPYMLEYQHDNTICSAILSGKRDFYSLMWRDATCGGSHEMRSSGMIAALFSAIDNYDIFYIGIPFSLTILRNSVLV